MKVFHIDRAGSLQVGENYDLHPIAESPSFSKSTKITYPDGLSQHGFTYLQQVQNILAQDSYSIDANTALLIDYIFEYERLIHFPNKNSRVQGLFVLPNLEAVNEWTKIFNIRINSSIRILELEFTNTKTDLYDACLLNGPLQQFSIQEMQDKARIYWSGEMTANPQREWIMKPPFKVLRVVDYHDLI